MNFKTIASTALTAFVLATTAARADVPINDKPLDALVIADDQTIVTGNLEEATPDVFLPMHGKTDLKTVWYRMKAVPAGSYFLQVSGESVAVNNWVDPNNGDEWVKGFEDAEIPIANDSTKLTGYKFTMTKAGTDIYIQVGTSGSGKSDFQLNIVRMGTDPANQLVTVAPNSMFFGMGKFNSPASFTKVIKAGEGPYVINTSDKAATLTVTTTFPNGTVKIDTPDSPLPAATGYRMSISSIGNGPYYGQVGSFRRSITFALKNGVTTLGLQTIPGYLLRFGQDMKTELTFLPLVPTSHVDDLGASFSTILRVKNTSNFSALSCFPINFGLNGSSSSSQIQYQVIDPVTNAPIGKANTPIKAIAPGKTAAVKIFERLNKSEGLSISFFPLFCAEGGTNLDQGLIGETIMFTATEKDAPGNAWVAFPDLKSPRLLKFAKNGSAKTSFTVTNVGPDRKLVIFASDVPVPVLTTGQPVTAQVCLAKGTVCAKTPVTSMKVLFKQGETRKFYVTVRGKGEAISANLENRLYIQANSDGRFAGIGGFAIATK